MREGESEVASEEEIHRGREEQRTDRQTDRFVLGTDTPHRKNAVRPAQVPFCERTGLRAHQVGRKAPHGDRNGFFSSQSKFHVH